MRRLLANVARSAARSTPDRPVRPALENLESRLLLYSTLGAEWTYDSRITYSFMPDGTSVGGVPSALFSTLNAVASTPTWQAQFENAASLWETASNVNLTLVSDGGQAVGCNGNQQDDPRFGDIRIGAIPLASGVLAETFIPPPINGGTDAGDIIFNSNVTWGINSTYDIMTVAAHEFGHALGLGESTVSIAAMYGTYNGIKQVLASDDISGIDSIYGPQQYDQFNSNGSRNNSFLYATNITSDINSVSQIAIPSLDNTTPTDDEWYVVTVPTSTTGQMTVSVQSSNLSSFAPDLIVYNSSLGQLSNTSSQSTGGVTVSTTLNVTSGQKYYFKVLAAGSGTVGTVGSYGLLVNFGSQTQSPIPPPNTVVPQQPNQGGGVTNNTSMGPSVTPDIGGQPTSGVPGTAYATVGTLSGWVAMLNAPTSWNNGPTGNNSSSSTVSTRSSPAVTIANQSIGALPSALFTSTNPTTTSITPTGGSTGEQIASAVASAITPNVDVIFQAVDAALQGWTSHRTRTVHDGIKTHHS